MPPEIRFGPAEEYDPRYEQFQYEQALDRQRFNEHAGLTVAQELLREHGQDRRERYINDRQDQREQFRHDEAGDQRQFVADQNQVKQQGAIQRIHERYDSAGQAKVKQIQDARQRVSMEMGQLLDRDPQQRNPNTRARMNYYQRFMDSLDQHEAGVPTVQPAEPPLPDDVESDLNQSIGHYQTDENGQREFIMGGLPPGTSGTVYQRNTRNGQTTWQPHEIKADQNIEQQKHDLETAKAAADEARDQRTAQRALEHDRRQGEQKLYFDRVNAAQKYEHGLLGQMTPDPKHPTKSNPTYKPDEVKQMVQDRFGDLDSQKPTFWNEPAGGQPGMAAPPQQQQQAPGPAYNPQANAIIGPAAPGAQIGINQPPPVPAASGDPSSPLLDPQPGPGSNLPSAPKAGLAQPQTEDDYNALPSGTVYVDPRDGKKKRKK